MKKSLLLLFCVIAINCNDRHNTRLSDKATSDTLISYLNSAKNTDFGSKSRIQSANKALAILEEQENSNTVRTNLNVVAKQYYLLKNDKKVEYVVKKIIDLSAEVNDSLNIAKAYNILGNQYINHGANDSAFYYFLKAEKLFSRTKDSLELGKNYIDKAFVQLYVSDYSGCELSCIQALGYYKNSNSLQSEYDAFNLIGISSNELKNYENALLYHQKALNYVNRFDIISNSKVHYRSSTLNNIGYVYQNLNNHKEAIMNFTQGLSETNLLRDNPYVYAAIIDNLAYSKFKLKDYKELPRLFFEALRIREINQLNSGVVASKLHLSEFYMAKFDTLAAQKMANEALKLSKETKITGDLLGSLNQLSTVEPKNASKYSKEYIKISDSIQQEERKAKDRFARIQYETDEIIGEKDKLAEQNRNLLYFFIGTLLIGLLLFVIRNQRAKNRELLLIQAQQKANEEIYNLMISQQETIEESRVREKKRIAQELHDGVLGRLFGARLNLDSLNKFDDEESITNRFNYLNELKNIEQDIREISHDLNREKYVLINNFVAIVNNLLEEQKSSHEPNLSWNIDSSIKWDTVNNTVKINFYRILQESLQNINKYAKANNIRVDFQQNEDNIILEVSDDGNGFDISIKKKGIGLQNMFSRVKDCNGTIDIKSKKSKGTIIIVILPK